VDYFLPLVIGKTFSMLDRDKTLPGALVISDNKHYGCGVVLSVRRLRHSNVTDIKLFPSSRMGVRTVSFFGDGIKLIQIVVGRTFKGVKQQHKTWVIDFYPAAFRFISCGRYFNFALTI
jgi:hypothetical protein